jgi:long-subunit acyl-CoA synthetase (AMP-forming)
VPLYDTLGETAIEFIMNHAEIKFVVGNAAKLPAVLKALKGFKGQLKGIAYWGTAPADVVKVRVREGRERHLLLAAPGCANRRRGAGAAGVYETRSSRSGGV